MKQVSFFFFFLFIYLFKDESWNIEAGEKLWQRG